jgi:VanZ family protein
LELGWVGVALAALAAVARAAGDVAAVRRMGGGFARLLALSGIGALAANAVLFVADASALLVPNLLVLAAVAGLVRGARTSAWRGRARLGQAHWPFVVGALGLIAALGVAESEMLRAVDVPRAVGDKVMHFGTFAALSLLLCYALGPGPGARYPRLRIVAAVGGTVFLGCLMELGQRYLTGGRAYEMSDVVANAAGALTMGALWWLFRRGGAAVPPAGPDR